MKKTICFGGLIPAIIFFILMVAISLAANSKPATADATTTVVVATSDNGDATTAWPPKNFGAYGESGKFLTHKQRVKKGIAHLQKNKAASVKAHKIFNKKKHRKTIRAGHANGMFKKLFRHRHGSRCSH